MTQGVIHELIHAYDECRAKNLDWNNCYHRACAEVNYDTSPHLDLVWLNSLVLHSFDHHSLQYVQIRASFLSGDCHYMREYLRGQRNLRGHETVSFLLLLLVFYVSHWSVCVHLHNSFWLYSLLKECVRRRAASSVSKDPRCTEYLTKLALDSVWDICYNDTKPFDKVPWYSLLVVVLDYAWDICYNDTKPFDNLGYLLQWFKALW